MLQSKRKYAIILFGPPGSGKSTLARFLEKNLLAKKISGGTLLRRLAAQNTGTYHQMAKKTITSGGHAPDKLMYMIFKTNIRTRKQGIVFDGNPSGRAQARMLLDLLNQFSYDQVYTIRLRCSEKKCTERILNRIQKRDDNTELQIGARMLWYNTNVKEAYDELKNRSDCNITVNANKEQGNIGEYIISRLTPYIK